MDVGHDVGQPPPLADGQAARHLHQALDEVQLLLLGVADGQVPPVHVHLPGHLFWTTQLHLVVEQAKHPVKIVPMQTVHFFKAFLNKQLYCFKDNLIF